MVTDFPQDLENLREVALHVTLTDLLHRRCDEEILKTLDSFILKSRSSGSIHFGPILGFRVAERITEDGNGWAYLTDYCSNRLNDDMIAPYFLLECLLYLYKPNHVAAWIGQNVVAKLEPNLEFDKDDLLIGPLDEISYRKEGILTNKHFLLYHHKIPGQFLINGFIDDLLKAVSRSQPKHFGLAIDSNATLSKKYYFTGVTKAYIRGPIGISESKLTDPKFPEDKSGTVTVHKQVGENILYKIFPLDRIEVMWSKKGNHKTIQIEELVAPNTIHPRAQKSNALVNRYMHAQWHILDNEFCHFDGAVKTYDRSLYEHRLRTDIKKSSIKPCYQKLFKIDDSLSLQSLCDLTTKFYEENDLVREYFQGEYL